MANRVRVNGHIFKFKRMFGLHGFYLGTFSLWWVGSTPATMLKKKQLIRMNGGFTEVEVPPENPRGEVVEGDGGEGHRKLHPITFPATLAWW